MNPRQSRRTFCSAFAGLMAMSFAIGCAAYRSVRSSGVAPVQPTVPATLTLPASGHLVIVQSGNLFNFDLGTRRGQPMTQFSKGAYAWSPALSHDHKHLAFGYFVAPKSATDLGQSDLYLADVNGANARLLSPHPVAGATFEDPCWTADDRAILATLRQPVYRQGIYQRASVAIVRVGIDGSEPTILVNDGMGPGVSPDGKYVAYTGVDPQGEPSGFYLGDAQGLSAAPLLDQDRFALIRFPAFSPDSSRLVFSAIGGPDPPAPRADAGWLPPGFGVAEADGPPWEVWFVQPDGSNLQRLTHISEDTPVPTWSPNGDWVALAGSYGLYLLDPNTKQTTRISKLTSGGGVAWPR